MSIGTLRTDFDEILTQNLNVFIHENVFENVVCEMAAILCRGRWINKL